MTDTQGDALIPAIVLGLAALAVGLLVDLVIAALSALVDAIGEVL